MKTKIKIFALAAQGIGISGSDRIFIELSRRWQKSADIEIITWKEGAEMISKQKLVESNNLKIISLNILFENYLIINYFLRVIKGIIYALNIKLKNSENVILYNASEFWMDSLPCVVLKARHPKLKWVATWYQTAPNPLKGFSEKSREDSHKFKAFLYWFMQFPIKPLIKKYADVVIVNNETERVQFKNKNTIVLIGAVPLDKIDKFKKKIPHLVRDDKMVYDGVFQGRFHPQKGVSELIDIWKSVVEKTPGAKLALIGDGPLMNEVKQKIKKYKLEKNIKTFGFMFDSDEKFKVFAQSKIVLHPAFYDSGGMASAEAMAFGLPCIGFDLKAYKSYYPKGMLKAKNEKEFSNLVIKLLDNAKLRNKIGSQAEKLIYENYSWDKRAKEIYEKIK